MTSDHSVVYEIFFGFHAKSSLILKYRRRNKQFCIRENLGVLKDAYIQTDQSTTTLKSGVATTKQEINHQNSDFAQTSS